VNKYLLLESKGAHGQTNTWAINFKIIKKKLSIWQLQFFWNFGFIIIIILIMAKMVKVIWFVETSRLHPLLCDFSDNFNKYYIIQLMLLLVWLVKWLKWFAIPGTPLFTMLISCLWLPRAWETTIQISWM
jgi:hypothetical protein